MVEIMNYRTRKDKRKTALDWPIGVSVFAGRKVYQTLKKVTAKRNRNRPITDETPYKRLDDPWNYD
jgi:hypothetical protein